MKKKKDRTNNDARRRGDRCPHCGRKVPPSVAGAVLARLGTRKGGHMRSAGMTHARRVEIARAAAEARWHGDDDDNE